MDTDGLKSDNFAAFFQALWGFEPFPWQQDLLERLASGKDPRRNYDSGVGVWPDVLDLPTGSGKTAALDVAVFHLALEALKKDDRRAPLRIAYVVDRRLIVDDAFARAERMSQALRWSLLDDERAIKLAESKPDLTEAIRRVRAEGAVKRAALRLCELAGSDQPPLIARSLRGGAPREDDWARTPVQPTILCSTVDQVGSRLLFRGYGVSDRMKPIHAGLLGSDCLILLDEAHLSKPFRQTLDAVRRMRAPDNAPFGFALLTATPAQDGDGREKKPPFALSADDTAHPVLARRITAVKLARLIEITGKQGVDTESRRADAIAQEARSIIDRLKAAGITYPAVGVVVNRVARARAVFERLEVELKDAAKIILLIGPARPVDRDKHAAELDPIRTGQHKLRQEMSEPLIVVATQTIEAGVDIDFDGLVTEVAALDALRQRFGRLNRDGRDIKAGALILAHKDDISTKADDPVYGDRITATWQKLQQLAAEAHGVVDFGVEALRTRVNQYEASKLAAPTEDAPVLMPAYADLWSQTWPIPNADPDVALFLHGPDRAPASVQMVWRADLDRRELVAARDPPERARLIELFALVPPRAAEAIDVPLWAARAFLERQIDRLSDLSDINERQPPEGNERGTGLPAFRWAGDDSRRSEVVFPSALIPGDLIVLPADYGGCDKWGWNPQWIEPVIDVAERAAWPYRARRFAVRVTPELIEQGFRRSEDGSESQPLEAASRVAALRKALGDYAEEREKLLDAVLELELPQELRCMLEAVGDKERRRGRGRIEPRLAYGREEPERGVVFIAPRELLLASADTKELSELSAMPSTESEDLGAGSNGPVGLVAHCEHVCAWTAAFAAAAGLSSRLADDVTLAGSLHDPGKADPRYQAYYAGGDPFGPDLTDPLAKSGQRHLPPGAWERAGLPGDWRHEALSVRLALLHADEFIKARDPELVLWLIGTHHGYGRPFFPHADPLDAVPRVGLLKAYGSEAVLAAGNGPQSLAFDFNGLDWAQMFERLKTRYGIWGLARLEAFVRLADHRASEEEAPPKAARPRQEAAE
jgi:CRISPR-associated endonuclease/helicase Cas3